MTINIYPELITWKKNKQGLMPLTIRFDFNRSRAANESIHHSVSLDDWNSETRRVRSSNKDHELLNQLIDNLISQHKTYFLRRQTFKLPITKQLINLYVHSGSALESFYEYADQVIKTKKLSDGGEYAEDTKRRYDDELKRLMQFRPVLSFRDITVKMLEDYKVWMQTKYEKKDGGRLQPNSIWKAFAFMRMVYNQAIKEEIILSDDNPFKKFHVGGYEENLERIKYLEKEDLDKLENLLQQGSGLPELTQRVGWRFLAMCVSGLRISDAMLLDDAFFNDGGDLEFKPYKTRRHGNKAQVPIISDRQKLYLVKTISLPLPKTAAKSFRTTFNIHLKILAAAAGISVHLTSHAGRHTMGSFLVDAGVETKAAKAILGVKKDRVLETYMHLKENKLKQEAMKLKGVF